MGRLSGKVAIITGTSQGLGVSIMEAFAREGAIVVGTARRVEMVQKNMDELRKKGDYEMTAMHQDITLREDWEKVVSETVKKYGKVDILVNNAAECPITDIFHCTEEEMIRVFKINVISILLGIQTVVPEFEKVGKGSIVNVNSIASIVSGDGDGGSTPYSASKGAGRSLSRHAAYYLAPKNIRVNTVNPGGIRTPMREKSLGEASGVSSRAQLFNPLPPHICGPEDIAAGIVYLASDEAKCVTGAAAAAPSLLFSSLPSS